MKMFTIMLYMKADRKNIERDQMTAPVMQELNSTQTVMFEKFRNVHLVYKHFMYFIANLNWPDAVVGNLWPTA